MSTLNERQFTNMRALLKRLRTMDLHTWNRAQKSIIAQSHAAYEEFLAFDIEVRAVYDELYDAQSQIASLKAALHISRMHTLVVEKI